MTSPPPKTMVITGISPHSPLSTQLAIHLLDHFHTTNTPISLALLGPSQSHLTTTLSSLLSLPSHSSTKLLTIEVDLHSSQSIGIAAHSIRAELGAADLVIHNPSAHLPYPSSPALGLTAVRGADEDEWWGVFEVVVRSVHGMARHFFTKMTEGAVFVCVVPMIGGENEDGDSDRLESGMAAWDASALAAERLVRYLGAENQRFRCESVRVRQGGEVSEEGWRESVDSVVRLSGL